MTEECKIIARAVRDLCTGSKRQTLLYISDVLKGANTAKIRSYQHDKAPYYGKLQSWTLPDIQRLLNKMVLDDYLKEEIIYCRDMPQAYLRLGTRIDKLMNGNEKVQFAQKITEIKTKRPNDAVAIVVPAAAAGSATGACTSRLVLDDTTKYDWEPLNDRCHNDLLDLCRKYSSQLKVTMVSIMNMQAIKQMSRDMPVSEEEMMRIPHVTQANFDKYGKEFLKITERYASEKLCKYLIVRKWFGMLITVLIISFWKLGIILDLEEQQKQSVQSEPGPLSAIDDYAGSDDETNWSQLAASSSQAPGSSGRKRKRTFRKYSPSKNKRRRTASPRKRKTGSTTNAKKKVVRGKAVVDPSRKRIAGKLGKPVPFQFPF